jgi:hypothetical protein
VIRIGVSMSLAVAAVLAGVRAQRASLGEGLIGAALGLLLVNLVREQRDPLELA